jgi:hypothetical protein
MADAVGAADAVAAGSAADADAEREALICW